MYLFWFIIGCVAVAFVFKTFFKINFEDSVGMSQLGIIIILFLCYILDILQLGCFIICLALTVNFILALILTCRQKLLLSAIKEMIGPPFIAYMGFLCIVYLMVCKNEISRGDELSYWASLPKVLFRYDGALQLNGGFQEFCVDYIPAMPLYMYFLEKINSVFNDGLLYFGYAAFTGALLLPAGKKVQSALGTVCLIVFLYIIPLFFYNTSTNDSAVFYQSLYIDPVLGIVTGCLIWLFLQAPWKRPLKWGQFVLYACFISLLKSSGIAFIVITMLILVIYLMFFEKAVLKKSKIWGGIFLPFLLYLFWHITLKYYHIDVTVEYTVSSVLDTGFIKTFAAALVKESLLTPYIKLFSKYCTFVTLFLLMTVIMIFLQKLQIEGKKANQIKRDVNICLIRFSYAMAWIQCGIYVTGLYALCVGSWNYQMLSFRRYICTILEMLICFISCNILYDFDILKSIRQKQLYKILEFFLILSIILIAPLRRINDAYDVFPQYVYEDSVELQNALTGVGMSSENAWNKVVILIDEKETYEHWVRAFYGHMKNLLAYALIFSDIQVNHTIYYTSQMEITSDNGIITCRLPEKETWIKPDYILWCHGHYPDTPILSWELYKVKNVETSIMSMEIIKEGKREGETNYAR